MSAAHRIKLDPPAAGAGLDAIERQAAAGREHVARAAEAVQHAAARDGDGFGRGAERHSDTALRRAAGLLGQIEQLVRDAELTIMQLVAHDRSQVRFNAAPPPPIAVEMLAVSPGDAMQLPATRAEPASISGVPAAAQPPVPADPMDEAVDELFARQDVLIDMLLSGEMPPEQLERLALEPGECVSPEFEEVFWQKFLERHPELDGATLRETPGYRQYHPGGMAGLLLAALASAAWLRFRNTPAVFNRGTPLNDTMLAYASAYSEYFPRLTPAALIQEGLQREFDQLVDKADTEGLSDDERIRFIELQLLMGGGLDTDAPVSDAQQLSGSRLDDVLGLLSGITLSGIKHFDGNKVYQRNSLFDPSRIDSKGRTNIQRMKKGIAPIGYDGKSIELHHLLQLQDGPIIEMTRTEHEQYSRTLHINPNTIPSGIDRGFFDNWRARYYRWRVKEFKK